MEHTELDQNGRKKHRVRTRTRASIGTDGVGRAVRIEQRNKVLVARWYYWTECKRLRADDAILRLCDEFFVESRTVTNAILQGDEYFRQLLNEKPTKMGLQKIHNGFNWA